MSINNKIKNKLQRKADRRRRVRAKIFGTAQRPRLSIYRSNKHVFVQLIDDQKNTTLAFADDKDFAGGKKSKTKEKNTKGKTEAAFKVGEAIAQKSLALKIKKAVFDRGSYLYHGRIKSFAEGARKGGLEF